MDCFVSLLGKAAINQLQYGFKDDTPKNNFFCWQDIEGSLHPLSVLLPEKSPMRITLLNFGKERQYLQIVLSFLDTLLIVIFFSLRKKSKKVSKPPIFHCFSHWAAHMAHLSFNRMENTGGEQGFYYVLFLASISNDGIFLANDSITLCLQLLK